MTTISFVTANYVAREAGFQLDGGWGQGDSTTRAAFRPIDTFEERLDDMLGDIQRLGFDAIDLWEAHLSPTWATDRHIAAVHNVLARRGMTIVSLAGGYGDDLDGFATSCRLAVALGAGILGGSTGVLGADRHGAVELLEHHNLRLAIENHPHVPTPESILATIGDGGGGRIGAAVDTGHFATAGCDPVEAIERLGPYIMTVHLKDILAAGAHDTCRFGDGIVPIEACVRALQALGYDGPIAIENEPEDRDPTEECRDSLQMLRGWLAS